MKSLSQTLASQFERAWIFVVIKPGFTNLAQDIIGEYAEHGWTLKRIRTKQLLLQEAHRLYAVHKKEDFYEDLCKYMSSDISVGIIFEKNGKPNKDMFKQTNEIKEGIRDRWGESDMRNVIHSSDSLSAMSQEAEIYF